MAITAYQVAYSQSTGNGLVTPVADRRLYKFLLTKTVGVDGRLRTKMLFDTANIATLVVGIILILLLGYIVNDK